MTSTYPLSAAPLSTEALSTEALSTEGIEHRIVEVLRDDGVDAARRVWVTTEGTRALLHGSVRTSGELRHVKRAAAAAPHVRSVLNLIEIRP